MKSLFPYPVLFGDVSVSVDRIAIDGHDVPGRVLLDQRLIDLEGIERSEWRTVELEFEVSCPPAEVAEGESVAAIAVLNCGPSNTRVSAEMRADDASPGHWHGSVELERDYWFDQAELRCGVVATVEGVPNRIIGWADLWMLTFDDLPSRPSVGGAIQITWLDFADPPAERQYLKQHSDKYSYLSIDPAEPQLFLNKGFEGLEALLVDRKRRNADKALHDQTRASIADKTWMALFNAALGFVEAGEDDDEPKWPEVDWQRTVLEALLALMYPDESPDVALLNAYTARNSGDAAGTLQELLAPAANLQARAPRLLRDGIRLLGNEPAADQEEDVA